MTSDKPPAMPSTMHDLKCAAPSNGHGQPPPAGNGGAIVAAILLQGVLAASDRLGDAAAQLDRQTSRAQALRDA